MTQSKTTHINALVLFQHSLFSLVEIRMGQTNVCRFYGTVGYQRYASSLVLERGPNITRLSNVPKATYQV